MYFDFLLITELVLTTEKFKDKSNDLLSAFNHWLYKGISRRFGQIMSNALFLLSPLPYIRFF